MNGIKDAIILLINGQENNSSSFTERIKSNNHMVAPLEMIESATVNSNVKRVHLVLADEFSLPGSPTELPWPLDISLVDSMIKQVSPKRRKYMEALKSIVVNSPVSNRYLFFTFMGLENVELSIEWISKKENREIEVSPFVSLFNFINPSDEKTKNEVGLSGRKIPHFNLEPQQPTSVPDDVLLDFVLCKERYIYSYILNEYPFFSTDFHYAFLLTKIITAFSEVTKEEPKLISQEMNELFPFFRSVELKQSLDYVSSKLKGKIPPIIYDNVEYPGARLQIHYLDNEIIDYCEKIQGSNFDDTKSMVPSPKKKCIFCPYSNICMVRFSKEDDAHES